MIGGILICDNEKPKCRGTMFEEVYAMQVLPPLEEEFSQTGKLKVCIGTAKYIYRCVNCGKVRDFSKVDEPPTAKKKQATTSDLDL